MRGVSGLQHALACATAGAVLTLKPPCALVLQHREYIMFVMMVSLPQARLQAGGLPSSMCCTRPCQPTFVTPMYGDDCCFGGGGWKSWSSEEAALRFAAACLRLDIGALAPAAAGASACKYLQPASWEVYTGLRGCSITTLRGRSSHRTPAAGSKSHRTSASFCAAAGGVLFSVVSCSSSAIAD